jgi:hypothetical protein
MVETPTVAEKPQKKRLAVFLDGTWNAVGDNTNVWRLNGERASTRTSPRPTSG